MDLLSLIATCAFDYDRATMHKIIALESGGRPYSYRVVGEGKGHDFDTVEAAIQAALAEVEAGREVRIGLTGIQPDLEAEASKPLAGLWEPCANIAIAARQLAAIQDNCDPDAEGLDGSATYCAIARWHAAEFGEPDESFAQNVMLYPDNQLPNPSFAKPRAGSAERGSSAAETKPAAKPQERRREDEWQPENPSEADQEIIDGGGTLFFDDVTTIGVTDKGDRQVIVEAQETAPHESDAPERSDESSGRAVVAGPDADGSEKDNEDREAYVRAKRVLDE